MVRVALQRISWRVPEWWAAVAAVAAWASLVAGTLIGQDSMNHIGHVHPLPTVSSPDYSAMTTMSCVVAMMVPLVLPTLRRVALASLWPRRDRAMLACLVGYVAIWTGFSLVIGGLTAAIAEVAGAVNAILLTSALALIWHHTAAKRRALRRCHLMLPIAPSGWRADMDCVRLGATIGCSCAVNCSALMTLVFASGHHLGLMLGTVVLLVIERFGRGAFLDVASGIVSVVNFALSARHPGHPRRSGFSLRSIGSP